MAPVSPVFSMQGVCVSTYILNIIIGILLAIFANCKMFLFSSLWSGYSKDHEGKVKEYLFHHLRTRKF